MMSNPVIREECSYAVKHRYMSSLGESLPAPSPLGEEPHLPIRSFAYINL